MGTLKNTLKERGEVYGDYAGGTLLRTDIMTMILERHEEVNGRPMDKVLRMFILDIVNKLSRLAITPDHIDSWHDIAGYATLTEEALKNEIQKPSEIN
jgi:hypothetical protein